MSIEELVEDTLQSSAQQVMPLETEWVHVEQRARRRHRRSLVSRAVVLILFVALGAAVVVSRLVNDGTQAAAPPPTGTWTPLADGPLSARYGAQALWTGEVMLIVGGTDTDPCPPGASCAAPERPPLTDGAVYDPAAQVWKQIADAPLPIGSADGAIVGNTLFLLVRDHTQAPEPPPEFLAYHLDEDRWEQLDLHPSTQQTPSLEIEAAGSRLIVYPSSRDSGSPDLSFDPQSEQWEELPADPIRPSLHRSYIWTGHEAVLLAADAVDNPGSLGPNALRAAALDIESQRWRGLPDSEIVGSALYWAGNRIVSASLGTSDGGDINPWDRSYPHGGMLDPAAGVWEPLPNPPTELGEAPGLSAGGGDSVVFAEGYVLHVPSQTWTQIGEPPVAIPNVTSTVWTGEQLLFWGGYRGEGPDAELLSDGWLWKP